MKSFEPQTHRFDLFLSTQVLLKDKKETTVIYGRIVEVAMVNFL